MAVIRESRQFKIGPIGVARASTGGVGQTIASAADEMAGMFFREGAKAAEKYGLEAATAAARESIITINPKTGKPEAFDPPEGFGGIATEAYQRVIRSRFQQSVEEEIKLKSRELAVQFEDSANAVGLYEEAMSNYIASMANNAEGEFAGYISDVGASYLNATRSNLAIDQIRRERAAAKKAATAAYNNGLESLESIYAIKGPSAESGEEVSQQEFLDESVSRVTSDGSEAGLFSPAEVAQMDQRQRIARASGLIRFASKNATDSRTLRQIQGAIGTQDPTALPAGYEYLAKAMVGLSFSSLADLEKVSDGIFSDRIPMIEAREEEVRLAREADERVRAFDIEQNVQVRGSAARASASDSDAPIGNAKNAYANYQAETQLARTREGQGREEESKAILQRRDAHINGVVEGLAVNALEGLTAAEALQVEAAIFNGDSGLAPESSRNAVDAILYLSTSVDTGISEDFLQIIGSYRDGPAKVENLRAQIAAEKKLQEDVAPIINSVGTAAYANIQSTLDRAISAIDAIDGLDSNLADAAKRDAYTRASKAASAGFFATRPTEVQIAAALGYIQTGSSADVLNRRQRSALDKARAYVDESGNLSALQTYMNGRASQRRKEIADLQAAEEKSALRREINLGLADPSLKTNQEEFSEILEEKYGYGKPLAEVIMDPENVGPIIDESRKVGILPRELHNLFRNFSMSGRNLNNAPVVLSYWNQLRTGTTTDGVEYLSPAVSSLSFEEVNMLDTMAEYVRIYGDDPAKLAEAMAPLREYQTNKEYKARVDAKFGEDLGSVDAFILSLDGANQVNPRSLSGVRAAAIQMAAMGMDIGEIEDRLNRQIDVTFPKTEGMVMSLTGEFRSAAALSRILPSDRLPVFQKFVQDMVIEEGFDSEGNKLTQAFFGPLPSRYSGQNIQEFAQTNIAMSKEGVITLQPIGSVKKGNTTYRILRIRDGEVEPILIERNGVKVPATVSTQDPNFISAYNAKVERDKSEAMRKADEQPTIFELERNRRRVMDLDQEVNR